MNGIEKISARIKADADAEIEVINAEAKAYREEIISKNNNKARTEYERITAEAAEEAEMRFQRACGSAKLESRKQILAEKQSLMDAAFALAKKQITEMPEAEYIAFCAELAAKASTSGVEEIIFSEKDRKAFGEKVVKIANELLKADGKNAELVLSAESRDISGGVILVKGLVETNCSVGTLVDRLRPELSSKVASLLFD